MWEGPIFVFVLKASRKCNKGGRRGAKCFPRKCTWQHRPTKRKFHICVLSENQRLVIYGRSVTCLWKLQFEKLNSSIIINEKPNLFISFEWILFYILKKKNSFINIRYEESITSIIHINHALNDIWQKSFDFLNKKIRLHL